MERLEERWDGLGADGGALKTDDIADIKTYLETEAEWWRLSSIRRESRADLQLLGKRKTLDGFFSKVRLELKEKFPGAEIKVGYGSAGMARRRRGAMEIRLEAEGTNKVEEHTDRTLRYPEIRGLRFSPERRIYLDRDREAAATIARLRTIELLDRQRPAPFCWGRA